MVATTMLSITSLVNKLQEDYPNITFSEGADFYWSPSDNTVYYDAGSDSLESLLHELAHGLLGHVSYTRDVQLLEMERDAWNHARTILASRYGVVISKEMMEYALDSYRDWLHARSICPSCQATGVQMQKDTYKCLACRSKWRVNEARVCALRRYKITN